MISDNKKSLTETIKLINNTEKMATRNENKFKSMRRKLNQLEKTVDLRNKLNKKRREEENKRNENFPSRVFVATKKSNIYISNYLFIFK